MTELQITGAVFLTIAGWIFVGLVVKDIFLTIRICLANGKQKQAETLCFRGSGFWFTRFLLQTIRDGKLRENVLGRSDILIPIMQFSFWKGMLIAGFALLYLSIGWQMTGETAGENAFDDWNAALGLSIAVSLRFAFYELILANPVIFLIANIQFYSEVLFYAFICFYFITLWKKSKRTEPRLFILKHELGRAHLPFHLSRKLVYSYRANNLLLILQDWERWAEELRTNLKLHPQFIYSGAKRENNRSWLVGLGIVLDTAAALIVKPESEAIKRQAHWTFESAHRALTETSALLSLEKNQDEICKCLQTPEAFFEQENEDVLGAEIIFENEKSSKITPEELLEFEFRRSTFQPILRDLSDRLSTGIRVTENDGCRCS